MSAVVFLATIWLAACQATPPGADGAANRQRTQTDSAGITIVDNPVPAWPRDSGWTIDTTPTLTVGDTIEGQGYPLVDVVSALPLASGAIAVMQDYRDARGRYTYAVDVFDSTSPRPRPVARPGEGPGELSGGQPVMIESGPDTLLLWTTGNLRLTQIAANGQFIRTATLKQPPNTDGTGVYLANRPDAIRADGAMMFLVGGKGPTKTGPFTPTATVYVLGDSAKKMTSFGSFPLQEAMVIHYQMRADGGSVSMDYSPFRRPRSFLFMTGRYPLITSATSRWELSQYREDGRLARIVRAAIPEPPVPDSVDNPHGFPVPSGLTAIDTLYDDHAGHIWVGRTKGVRIPPGVFDVIDSTGTWLGPVTMPCRIVKIWGFSRDFVLIEHRGGDDVPILATYRIRRR